MTNIFTYVVNTIINETEQAIAYFGRLTLKVISTIFRGIGIAVLMIITIPFAFMVMKRQSKQQHSDYTVDAYESSKQLA